MIFLTFLSPIRFVDNNQRILAVFAEKAGEAFLEPKEQSQQTFTSQSWVDQGAHEAHAHASPDQDLQ